MAVVRAFIAIELSPLIKAGLVRTLEELKRQLKGSPVKWVPVDNIHLTLKFLGDVSVSNLDLLKDLLRRQAGNRRTFEFQVGELGAFPSTRLPRVIWVGVQAPPELYEFQKAIEVEASYLGYPREERSFSPHLTLGRVSRNASNDETRRIGAALETLAVGSLGTSIVQSVNLYQSDLQPGGAIYTCLFVAKLG